MDQLTILSRIINASIYFGMAGCIFFVIFEFAKRSVEGNFIKCTALRAYSAIRQGYDISFDGLKEIYVNEMNHLTGISGDLTKEEAWQIFLSIKATMSKDPTIDDSKRQWIIRSGERAIPEHYPSSKPEYFLALIVLFALLYGLNSLKRLIVTTKSLSLNETLVQSALVVVPSLIIIIVALIMTKWAIRSSKYRNLLEKSTLKT